MEKFAVRTHQLVVKVDENTYKAVAYNFETAGKIPRDPNTPESPDDDGVYKVGEMIDGNEIVGFYMDSVILKLPTPGIYNPTEVDPGAEDGPVVYEYVAYSASGGVPYEPFSISTDDFPVCFCKGTLVDTQNGAIVIENIKQGDYVLGSKGWQRVKWIGWRKYNLGLPWVTADKKAKCAPVRITQGALGNGVPTKDLLISPWHHVYIDGQLVRANDIVNDVTIVREMNAQHIEYYHLELDEFDVIQAHGVFSESWADGGNRSFFENVKVTELRPEDSVRRQADRPGFVLMRDKKVIRQLNRRLGKLANLSVKKKTA